MPTLSRQSYRVSNTQICQRAQLTYSYMHKNVSTYAHMHGVTNPLKLNAHTCTHAHTTCSVKRSLIQKKESYLTGLHVYIHTYTTKHHLHTPHVSSGGPTSFWKIHHLSLFPVHWWSIGHYRMKTDVHPFCLMQHFSLGRFWGNLRLRR